MTPFSFTTLSEKPRIRDIIAAEIPPIQIYDIGAMNEGRERFAALIDQDLADVCAFEPNPAEFQKLQSAGRPRRRYFPYFVGNGGPAIFHFTHYPGCCSLLDPDPSVINLFTSIDATMQDGNFAVKRTQEVLTTRLDDVADIPPCDFLKADVQGSELDVLLGAGKALANAVVIECEVAFIPLYKKQPLFGDIQIFLRNHGFVLHKFIDIAGRSFRPVMFRSNMCDPISQVLWADAVFVRDFSQLESFTDDQLIKAAVILYGVYHSYDLALLLIKEHDRRCAGTHAKRFHDMLATSKNLPYMYMNLKLQP